ncbi:MAG: M15 family metallopeptidase [Clostridium sp.]
MIIIFIVIVGIVIFKDSGLGRRLFGGENLVLVNRESKLDSDYNIKDLTIPNVRFSKRCLEEEKQMKEDGAKALEKLFIAAEKDGVTLYANSGFRSEKSQVNIIKDSLNKKGKEYTDKFVAKAGHSEHQTGLSMDITNSSRNFHRDSIEAKWLRENAHKYGFILRYPEGKENITGYNYEPWHIRYVGKTPAAKINKSGVVLEEYLQGK